MRSNINFLWCCSFWSVAINTLILVVLLPDFSTLSFCSSRKFRSGLKSGWFDNSFMIFLHVHFVCTKFVGHFIDWDTFSSDSNHLVIMHAQKWQIFPVVLARYIASYRISRYWRRITSYPYGDNSLSNESIFRTTLVRLVVGNRLH